MSAAAPGPEDIGFAAASGLVVVDVQNDFADPKGSLFVPEGDRVVEAVNQLVAAARASGVLVVYTQDWHPPSTPHFEKDGGVWPVHCVAETWGAALHPRLRVEGPVVRKGETGADGYSGFAVRDPETGAERPTELAGLLRDAGVTDIVVAGLALDYCVVETVLDGLDAGFTATLAAGATRPVDREPGDGLRAVARLVTAGAEVR